MTVVGSRSRLFARDRNPNAGIRKVNGIPRLFVDGKPVGMLAYRNRIHDDFAYMSADDDLANVREDPRYRLLIKRALAQAQKSRGRGHTRGSTGCTS